MTKIYNLLIS